MHSVTYPLLPAKASPLCERIAARAARNEEDKRALLGVALVNGDPIPRMSERQAAKATNVSRYKVRLAKLTTDDDIELIEMGRLRLSDVRRMRSKSKSMTDDQLIAFINCANPDRILQLLDAITAPILSVAAE